MRNPRRQSKLLRLGALAALTVAITLQGCGETLTQVGESDVAELRVSTDSADVAVGRDLQLRAYPLDASGALLVGQAVSWRSLDGAVASVDDAGLVTGEAEGETSVIASVGAFADTTFVTVELPPTLTLSDDSLGFDAVAGGLDPAPQSVDVTNTGGFPLVGITVDSIVYGAGASDWLVAQLDQPDPPATLDITASTTGLTTAGTYAASVWLSATDAEGSPAEVEVTLLIAAGTAASLTINDGDGQIATAGSSVAIAPSVLLTDAFDNPVVGSSVGFAVTGGAGLVAGTPAMTNASGVARVGSWTLGTVAGDNELTATFGVLAPVAFEATGVAGPATQVVVSAGDNQSAIAGSAVATPPSLTVQDAHGNGVEGIAVTFTVASGGGSITGGSQTSDADGIATVGSWTLGTTAGANTLSASAAGVAAPAIITATGLTGTATAVELLAGDAQSDSVAATLPTAYVVRVVDSNLNGVEGIPVSWEVTGGGGTIGGSGTASIDTDQDGLSTAVRVLGTTPGTHTVSAAVGGLNTVVFTATASVGSPDEIRITAGNGQTATVGTAVTIDPQVVVEDVFDNPIQGHSVTFSVQTGGGTVDPTTPLTTGADGTATATSWTLGTVAASSNNTLRAQATGTLTGNPVTFTATAQAGPATQFTIVQGDNQTAIAGTAVTVTPTVLVQDQYDNPIVGRTVTFSASGGGSPASTNVATNASGQASTSWTVVVGTHALASDGTFPNTLTASTAGLTSLQFSGFARYSYATDVSAIFPVNCSGCHGAWSYGTLVDVPASCDASLRRVQIGGGVAAANNSVLLQKLDPNVPGQGTCGAHSGGEFLSGAVQLLIMRAWIQNGAPNN